jgi:hypothetical protein
LGGVVADMLEPHEHRQDDALPLNSGRLLEALRKVFDCLAVERRLPAE